MERLQLFHVVRFDSLPIHLALRTEPIISAWRAVCSMGRTESWHLSEIGDMTQTEADRKPKLSSAGSTPALTFQRTAISGKLFAYPLQVP